MSAVPTEQPEGGCNHDDPQHRMDHYAQHCGDDNYQDGDENVEQHAWLVPAFSPTIRRFLELPAISAKTDAYGPRSAVPVESC
jgi:hypothetical protein